MSIEDDLRDSLRRRAASVDAQPDLDDVVDRTANRERRTRRLLTAGLVVALIAGPLAGFAIGRARDDGGSDVATGGAGRREVAAGAADAAMSSIAPGFGGPLEKLFFRTSADGVEIRAYRSAATAVDVPAPVCGPPASCPAQASECGQTITTEAMVVGELSTAEAVTTATGSASAATGTAVPAASWGAFGDAEGSPARWVIASTDSSVARVRATFPGGTPDEMEPVNGVVLLASKVADPDAAGGTLEALDADGTVVATEDLTNQFGGMASGASASSSSGGSADATTELHTESSASGSGASANASSSASSSVSGSPGVATDCIAPTEPMPLPPTVPPTLPEPGEQPADPAAARDEIATAFAKSFDGSVSPEESTLYEEGPGVSPDEVAKSPYAAQAGHTTATVTDVVFTSPTTASVSYDISIDNWPNQFPGQTGTALLIDGRWKVAQATVCAAAAIGGLRCG
jgi:hypothetical protein